MQLLLIRCGALYGYTELLGLLRTPDHQQVRAKTEGAFLHEVVIATDLERVARVRERWVFLVVAAELDCWMGVSGANVGRTKTTTKNSTR